MTRPHRTLLVSFAHPDDESYLAAGTLARYAHDGATRVVLVTATRGEAATLHADAVCARSELGDVRAAEIRRAAEILGVAQLHLLIHRDRRLGEADPERIRRELVTVIRASRPEVVVTFDPNGENLHPDHVAISRFTSDAIAVAADARWLPDAGSAHRVARLLWTPPTPVWTMLRACADPRDVARWPGVDFLIDIRAQRSAKRSALLAHETQRRGIDELLLGRGDADHVLAVEAFRQAWGPATGDAPAHCLFDGLPSPDVDGASGKTAGRHGVVTAARPITLTPDDHQSFTRYL